MENDADYKARDRQLSAEINALPVTVRTYLHELETNADPAGEVRARRLTEDENRMLRASVAALTASADSLRRDLAVKSAALAQCATVIKDAAVFLRSSRRHLEGTAVEGTPWFDGLVHLTGVLFSFDQHKDISYAVRVEAARDAVERAVAQFLTHVRFRPSEFVGSYEVVNICEQLRALHDALDGLTSERRRDGGGA